jgi:threonine dehydratase
MLSLSDIEAAREQIRDVARRTPQEPSITFSELTGADVRLKFENQQRTGAFKIRGATNRIATLSPDEREAGVVTASAGNHAQGVAFAATRADVDSLIVMPEYAPISKIKATERYGAEVVLHGDDYDEAQARAHEIEREEGLTYIHAFDDERVIAGQGTIGLEIVEDCPEVDTVVIPIGGGGLIAGVSTAITELTDARVIGVQAEGAASVAESLEKGRLHRRDSVDTIADGIATRSIGQKPFEIIRERVDDVVSVTDAEIAVALTRLLERSKTLAEGAGAVPVAATLFDRFDYEDDEVIVSAICGGNIDMNTLTTIILRGLVETGRYLKIRTELKDRPGALQELVGIISEHRANIYAIQHDRTSRDAAVNAAEVEIDLETRGEGHVTELLGALREHGYEVDVLA